MMDDLVGTFFFLLGCLYFGILVVKLIIWLYKAPWQRERGRTHNPRYPEL
jgi:hypothetical protein